MLLMDIIVCYTNNKYVSGFGSYNGEYVSLTAGEFYPIGVQWGHPITPTAVGLSIAARLSSSNELLQGFVGGFFHAADQYDRGSLTEFQRVCNLHGGKVNFLRKLLLGYI